MLDNHYKCHLNSVNTLSGVLPNSGGIWTKPAPTGQQVLALYKQIGIQPMIERVSGWLKEANCPDSPTASQNKEIPSP